MRYALALLLLTIIPATTWAADAATTPAATTLTSEQRIAQLEARVAQLENLIKPLLIEHEIKLRNTQNKNMARQRMQKDTQTYSKEQLQAMETLYQAANKNLKGENAKADLTKVVSDYGKSNRAGCALVYLGQISSGDEQVQYFKQAIDSYSDCFYGNGVQVGAYARLLLAVRYANDGKKDEALKLLDELAKDYPRSLDHKGQPLELSIGQLRQQLTAVPKQ
jgi:TolA-binding protein